MISFKWSRFYAVHYIVHWLKSIDKTRTSCLIRDFQTRLNNKTQHKLSCSIRNFIVSFGVYAYNTSWLHLLVLESKVFNFMNAMQTLHRVLFVSLSRRYLRENAFKFEKKFPPANTTLQLSMLSCRVWIQESKAFSRTLCKHYIAFCLARRVHLRLIGNSHLSTRHSVAIYVASEVLKMFRFLSTYLLILSVIHLSKADKYVRVCYFSNRGQYRTGIGQYLPKDIDPFLCTHVIYAFAKID